MTLKIGDRVEGKTKHIQGKSGVIAREVNDNSKRMLFVIWDDESQGSYFPRAVKKIRQQNEDDPAIRAIMERNIEIHQNRPLLGDEEDDNNSESTTESNLSVDRNSDNEIGPEDGLVMPDVDGGPM